MHNETAISHSQRFYPAGETIPDRSRLMGALKSRVYVDEHAIVVNNGLSTYLVCFPSDRTAHKDIVAQKIKNSREYGVLFKDVEEINALKSMPPMGPNYYMPLGLYIYFADECSRLSPGTTFLSEMRKAGAGFKEGEECDKELLFRRTQAALRNAGLGEENQNILREWATTNGYTLGGEWHGIDKEGRLNGSYALLARDICMRKPELSLNDAISYALGNKVFIQGKTYGETLAMTRALARKLPSQSINPMIVERLERGEHIRDKKIEEAIHQNVPLQDYSLAKKQRAEADAGRLLAYLPDTALETLYRRGYTIAYSNANSLDNVMPESETGDPRKEILKNKDSKAFRDPATCSLFISNGRCDKPELDTPGSQARYARGAQGLLHETMHIILRHATDKEKAGLLQALQNFQTELAARKDQLPAYFNEPLKTVDAYTRLSDMLDMKHARYSTYDKKEVPEEIICNLYSMMHTEFPLEARGNNPYRDLPSLKTLAQEINAIEQVSLKHLREETAHITVPVQARAIVH